jgi:two-component system, sensor histidine kinase and response regulator
VLSKPIRQSRLYDQIASVLSRAPAARRSGRVVDRAEPAPVGRVLVAEDNEINQIAARRVLPKLGYAVDTAEDGRAAIEMSARGDYGVVMMDCQMPEVDGYQATREIRRREGSERHTPIVAMTAYTMRGDREKCIAAGMDDYIAKPLRLAELRRVLSRLLDGGRGGGRGGDPSDEFAEPSVPPDAVPLIDEAIVEELLSDGGREEGIIDVFLRSSRERLDTLEHAISTGDGAAVARVAHSLKGACATFGANRMASIAAQLDGVAGAALLRDASNVHSDLIVAFEATEVALDSADIGD